MANTQLACPHCGSALTFGMEIRAGTPIECLICMQTFVAQPMQAAVAAVAKANNPPAGITVAEKTKAAPPPIPTANKAKAAPRQARADGAGAAKLGLVVVGLGAMFLMMVGAVFGVWLLASYAGRNNANPDGAIASNGGESPALPGSNAKANGVNKAGTPLVGDDDDDDLRRKREEEKLLLARKNAVKPVGADLEFDPISTVKTSSSVAGLDQTKINTAIEKGIAYLKKTQHPTGAWHTGHDLGYAAMGGLTLLECGVPADDLAVKRAAAFVRSHAAEHKMTYEISLSVLFLDRLGDPRDRPMIQWLALRVLAGQNESGGWSYNCPLLPPQEMYKLYNFLQSHRPALQNPLESAMPLRDPLAPELNYSSALFQQFHKLMLAQQIDNSTLPVKKGAIAPPKGKGKAPQPISSQLLMPDLRNIPVVHNQGKKKGQQVMRTAGGDNSNTQFAMLALWAARRHGVSSDAALLYSYHRFMISQSPDGGWGYIHALANTTHTMTCVGLLGEAMGHGAAPDVIGFNPKNPKEPILRPVMEDPAIKKGFAKLAQHIGEPSKDNAKRNYPMENLYFLWSVERVAVLYDLKSINGKDWYGWGAQILVYNQQMDGAWIHGQFHGESPPINTCFALLFLKRSNLVQDLTNQIRLHSVIRDPG